MKAIGAFATRKSAKVDLRCDSGLLPQRHAYYRELCTCILYPVVARFADPSFSPLIVVRSRQNETALHHCNTSNARNPHALQRVWRGERVLRLVIDLFKSNGYGCSEIFSLATCATKRGTDAI